MNRRQFLLAGSAMTLGALSGRGAEVAKPTTFQIACMTLPYSRYPWLRALAGIKSAGYRYVAWGTTHREEGKDVPVLAKDASAERARDLGKQCRDLGLEPLMLFSIVYPEHADGLTVLKQRVLQAEAAGIGQVLTFGHTEKGGRKLWKERFAELGPFARDHGVTLVIKQHGGETGTGSACADFTRELADANVKVNYDAGNVVDYLNADPIADFKKCAEEVRSFCIKDHRDFPKDEDCGPGFGEIDHYKLLAPVAFTGRAMPLCCENIFAPLVARPERAEGVDELARRAREFLETVVAGLQAR